MSDDAPLFRSAHAAVIFALNYAHQQSPRTPMTALLRGPAGGSGAGLLKAERRMDENKFEFRGVTYVAQDAGLDTGCGQCEFHAKVPACGASNRPPCSANFREDGRNIVWKKDASNG